MGFFLTSIHLFCFDFVTKRQTILVDDLVIIHNSIMYWSLIFLLLMMMIGRKRTVNLVVITL